MPQRPQSPDPRAQSNPSVPSFPPSVPSVTRSELLMLTRRLLASLGNALAEEIPLFCSAPAPESAHVALLAAAQMLALPADTAAALPAEIVWMPAGTHAISATTPAGPAWQGKVLCDAAGAAAIVASFNAVLASGRRVYLDRDHADGEATAWVTGFRWDPAQGIMAKVEWTSLGEQLLRGKVYYSFSPAFLVNKTTGRVSALLAGHAAGGLVNAPAFGAAMPALIAARLAGAEPTVNPASGGSPGTNSTHRIMKDLLVKILAALAVTVPPDATEEQMVALAAKHVDKLPNAGAEGIALKAQLAELETLKAAESTRRKADATAAVNAAVARGAIPPKDEVLQAKWRGLVEANPDHAQLLAALPDNPALTRVTTPGAGVTAHDGPVEILRAYAAKNQPSERAAIYARDISKLFASDPNLNLGPILAANSLGTLAPELITQRSLTLLKLSFPWLSKVSTSFTAEAAAFDQEVNARLVSVPTVGHYSTTLGYVSTGATATDVPVKISNHDYVQIEFNANELASTGRNLFQEQVDGMHYAIGKTFVDGLLALITVANFANESIEAVADTDRDTMDTLATALSTRGVPEFNRIGLLKSAVFRKLGKDSSIVNLAAMGQRPEIITQGVLPPISGIQPYELFNLPTDENLIGFACTPDALALATRLPNDYTQAMPGVPSTAAVSTVTNPDTGISLMMVRYIDHQLGKAVTRFAFMWGVAKGNPLAGQRLISAART